MYRDILIIQSTNNFKCLRKQILYNLIPSINEFCRFFSWDSWGHQLFILILQVQKEQLLWELPLQLYCISCWCISFFSCVLIYIPDFNKILSLKVSCAHLIWRADWRLDFFWDGSSSCNQTLSLCLHFVSFQLSPIVPVFCVLLKFPAHDL